MQELAQIRKKLSENPFDPLALCGAAHYYLLEGSYKQAYTCFSQATEGNPRQTARSLLEFEQAIEKSPEKTGLRLALAGFLLSIGAFDEALLELEELLDLDNKNVEAYNCLGRLFVKQERIDDAIALIEKSIKQGVRDLNLTEMLAAAYLEKGRLSEAVSFYEEILAQKQGNRQTLRVLGELYARLENYSRSAQCYQEMFGADPEVAHEVIQRLEELQRRVESNIEIYEILSDIYMKALNPEAAVAKLREIIRLEPSKIKDVMLKVKNILKNYPQLPSATLVLAEAQRKIGSYSEAAENYSQLLKIKPEYAQEAIEGYNQVIAMCPEQVLARLYLGEALLSQNRLVEAIDQFGEMVEADPSVSDTVIKKCRDILRTDPQLISAHIVLGKAYLAKGDPQRAAAEAEGVAALDKKSFSAYLLLGDVYSRMNMKIKSSQALSTALLLAPYSIAVHEKYKAAALSELDELISFLKKKTQDDRSQFALRLDLAKLYIKRGNREEAMRELQLAQKSSTCIPQALNMLGNIYRSEGRYDLAEAQYSRALESAAKDYKKVVLFNLGTAQEAQGKVRQAIKTYEGVMQDDIDYGNSKKRIKLLKSTSLQSMRNRPLIAVMTECGEGKIIALWGREIKSAARANKKEEVNISFGQEHNQHGFDYFIKGMYLAAEEELNLAVQLDRGFAVACNNLGITLARQGKLEEAKNKIAQSCQMDAGSAIYLNNLGVMDFLLGKADAAEELLEKCAALDPELSAATLNLADVLYHNKKPERALSLYRKIDPFDPLSDIVEQRLLFKSPSVSGG